MFESKEDVKRQVDAIYDHALGLDRGDILTWESIREATGLTLSNDETRLRYIVGKFRTRMRQDREIVIWSSRAVGLRFLTHEEAAVFVPEKRRRRMYREAGRAMREMRCADLSRLSVHQRRVHASQMERFTAERKSIRAGVKQVIQKSESLPKRAAAAK